MSEREREQTKPPTHTRLFLIHRQRLPILFLNLLELTLYRRLIGLGEFFPLGFDVAQWDEQGCARGRGRRGGCGRCEAAEGETVGRTR